MAKWRDIKTAPKDNRFKLHYILITDDTCLPDLVIWHNAIPAGHRRGCFHCAVPAGWFCVSGGRSRLDGKATYWMPVPDAPSRALRIKPPKKVLAP